MSSSFFDNTRFAQNPLSKIADLIEIDKKNETAEKYEDMRFVGYVLEIGFDEVKIITADPFKQAVGGIPRGTFLILIPDDLSNLPPHFSLLRVKSTAPTPLSNEVQQTYFELHKRSMPELDRFTASELQWGALATQVLGMFYPDPNDHDKMTYSGDVNNVVSGHRYKVYSPTQEILDLIVNGILNPANQWELGKLRFTECLMPFQNIPQLYVPVKVSTEDFKGFRTAMFGKTRLGKSNVVKLIAESIIRTTENDKSVGQLIFDINGEYANDNPQDGNASIRSAYPDRCVVYALNPREGTPSKPLKLNFFAQPDRSIRIVGSLLKQLGRTSIYITNFGSLDLISIEDLQSLPQNEKLRAQRRILAYWCCLHNAGFESNIEGNPLRLTGTAFNPGFKNDLRNKIHGEDKPLPNSLDDLLNEFRALSLFAQRNPDDKDLKSGSGNKTIDPELEAILAFLFPSASGAGASKLLPPMKKYHDKNAGSFVEEILDLLDQGQTVILDLGNADETVRAYFSDYLSNAVFRHQESKFTSNNLNKHFVQIYFEEAHNLFPKNDNDVTDIYSRFAKEGAKFHIGMVYSTQSPSTVNKDLLAQTENFFVAHLSSQDEANALSKLQVAYDGLERDILNSKTKGYLRMLTFSHRFVVPIQAKLFEVNHS
ncbi:ATP-binding protein [Ekhidna sp.]|uniref:ATP-binding protein n=1 Tax=Ekhidna sp. TaxID=2608089 RepID=UPI003B5C78EF